jgi:hypothetical protein
MPANEYEEHARFWPTDDDDRSPLWAEAEVAPEMGIDDDVDRLFKHTRCSVDADGYLCCSKTCSDAHEHGKKAALSHDERMGFTAAMNKKPAPGEGGGPTSKD